MEISKEHIMKSLELIKKNSSFDKLQEIYDTIPGGDCTGCTKCCMETVTAFYIEFLNVLDYINKQENLLEKLMSRIEEHYFTELYSKKMCPFLNENRRCDIYSVRPLVCRLFGYKSRDEHNENFEKVLDMNAEAKEYFLEEYNIELPKAVTDYKIEFCDSFKKGRKITINEQREMIDQMFNLDSEFLVEDLLFEDSFNMSLNSWFIYTKYFEEEASERRISQLLNSKI